MSSILLITLILLGMPPLHDCLDNTEAVNTEPSAVWLRLLQESERGEGSRSYVQEVAESYCLSTEGKLASLLIREWRNSKKEAPPRLLYTPKLPKKVIEKLPTSVVAQTIVVKAQVDERGLIESYEFVLPSRFEVLNIAVKEAIPHVRYRPARNSLGAYVSGEAVLSFRLHID